MANDSQDLMTISLSTGIQTKTTMTPRVPKLSWTEGDKFDLFSNGGDAKIFLLTSAVYVNGELEQRRGRKLRANDVVKVSNKEYQIVNDN